MKLDFDTFIYIILSIVILVLSGLGGARRRKSQQLTASTDSTRSSTPGMDAINALEQMFTGQLGFEEADQEETPGAEETIDEKLPREEISVEKEEKIQSRLEEGRFISIHTEEDPDEQKEDGKKLMVEELFKDVDEIKKAVIYSEIFQRRYI